MASPEIIEMVTPLFESMAQRVTAEELATIKRAFEFADHAHAPQRRKTGEPYIIHPIAVARIVGEELQLGANPVCAAFLHDVVEDTDYTIEDIESEFGSDIAFLVKVVTKTKKTRYENSKQVDNFRQMLESVKYDIRALLVKLADRLHNMRTLSSMPPAKQMKIAGETDYFYAPLANRLGLYNVKTELENLSFKYRCPREYARLENLLAEERDNIKPYLEDFRNRVKAQLDKVGVVADIDIVTRRPYSIQSKMLSTNADFHHLERMHSINIVYDPEPGVSEKATALKIYSALTDVFEEKPHSLSNYIDHPKENGYQSLHMHLLADNGHWQEIHVSSRRMQRVQTLGCIADADTNIQQWIEKLKSTLQDIASNTHEVGFMDGVVSSFYNDDISVLTPAGKSISLPAGASAIDFAFEVHTDVGMHAKYARINGKLCSLKTRLNRADLVEIGTDEEAHPDESWLDNVVTYKAKRHINSWLMEQPISDLLLCSHCHPIPGDEVIGFNSCGGRIEVHKRDCPIAIRTASQDGDSVVAVDFEADETLYPVALDIIAVNRSHLLLEIVSCISDKLGLPIEKLTTTGEDNVVKCRLQFMVHSFNELNAAIDTLNSIRNVDEVSMASVE